MRLSNTINFVFLLTMLLARAVSAGDVLEVDLRNASRDPLVDFTSPLVGSPDRVDVVKDGLRIRQGRDKPGFAKRDTGFKFLLSASGNFNASLDMKKVLLEEPTSGWGQGLIYSVFLDDPEQSVVQMGLLALPGSGQTIRTEKIGRLVKNPSSQNSQIEFKDGKLIIRRKGQTISFLVSMGGKEQLLQEIPSPMGDVQSLSVWCTRQDNGNSPAEFLLRTLTVESDGFYSYKTTSHWFTWWHGLGAASLTVLLIGLFLKARAANAN